GILDSDLERNGLDIALAAAHVALSGEITFGSFEDYLAGYGRIAGQAHLERVTDLDFVGVSLGDGSTHPGVVEVHDGDNRLAGGDHLAFARGADGDGPGDRREHARVTQTGFGLGKLRLRGGGLSAEGGDVAFGGVCLMGAGLGGIQGGGGSAHLVFERLYAGASCFQRGGGAVTVLLRSDALFGEREHALGVGGLLLEGSLSLR